MIGGVTLSILYEILESVGDSDTVHHEGCRLLLIEVGGFPLARGGDIAWRVIPSGRHNFGLFGGQHGQDCLS